MNFYIICLKRFLYSIPVKSLVFNFQIIEIYFKSKILFIKRKLITITQKQGLLLHKCFDSNIFIRLKTNRNILQLYYSAIYINSVLYMCIFIIIPMYNNSEGIFQNTLYSYRKVLYKRDYTEKDTEFYRTLRR